MISADERPVASVASTARVGRALVPPDERAHHGAQRQVGPDRQVNAPGHDHQELPSARTQITADCLRTLPRFSSDRKTSDSTAQHDDQQQEDRGRAGLQGGQGHGQAAVRGGGLGRSAAVRPAARLARRASDPVALSRHLDSSPQNSGTTIVS